MQVKGAEGVMLTGDILPDNTATDPNTVGIRSFLSRMFMVDGNTNCTINLALLPLTSFETATWTKLECLPAQP